MFEQKSAKETILELHSSAGNGLSEAEARKKLEQNGKNELKDGDIILCFGHLQADDAYLAEKIIMIEFNYD